MVDGSKNLNSGCAIQPETLNPETLSLLKFWIRIAQFCQIGRPGVRI
jgi:hypothetical protein